jgi:PhoH-like ATPase
MPKKAKKIFVVDTNVLLHDYKCIYNFEENDVVIPIVVLEELDRFKRGNDLINFHAREFTRELDKLSGDDLFNGGISLGEEMGMLAIETGKPYSEQIKKSFPEDTPDHRILAIAEHLHIKNQNKNVVLAKAIGIPAQDYKKDKVANIDELYKGISTVEGMGAKLISRMYEEYDGVPVQDFNFETEPAAHQYYILKNGKSSALAHYDPFNEVMDRVEKQKAYGIDPRNAEQAFALDALMRPEVQLVSLTGKAGTGKTLLALAAALYQRKLFTQIFLARPIVPLANRDMGFLPGDVKEKIEPYMQPLMDNLAVIKHKFSQQSPEFTKIDDMLKSEKLVITPLAYIRGRSLSRVFFIVDEAQNLTPHEVKTIITRAGEGTKMVFTGDIEQIDSPYLDSHSNGLSYLSDKMRGQEIFAHVNLVKGERSFLADLASNLL